MIIFFYPSKHCLQDCSLVIWRSFLMDQFHGFVFSFYPNTQTKSNRTICGKQHRFYTLGQSSEISVISGDVTGRSVAVHFVQWPQLQLGPILDVVKVSASSWQYFISQMHAPLSEHCTMHIVLNISVVSCSQWYMHLVLISDTNIDV